MCRFRSDRSDNLVQSDSTQNSSDSFEDIPDSNKKKRFEYPSSPLNIFNIGRKTDEEFLSAILSLMKKMDRPSNVLARIEMMDSCREMVHLTEFNVITKNTSIKNNPKRKYNSNINLFLKQKLITNNMAKSQNETTNLNNENFKKSEHMTIKNKKRKSHCICKQNCKQFKIQKLNKQINTTEFWEESTQTTDYQKFYLIHSQSSSNKIEDKKIVGPNNTDTKTMPELDTTKMSEHVHKVHPMKDAVMTQNSSPHYLQPNWHQISKLEPIQEADLEKISTNKIESTPCCTSEHAKNSDQSVSTENSDLEHMDVNFNSNNVDETDQ